MDDEDARGNENKLFHIFSSAGITGNSRDLNPGASPLFSHWIVLVMKLINLDTADNKSFVNKTVQLCLQQLDVSIILPLILSLQCENYTLGVGAFDTEQVEMLPRLDCAVGNVSEGIKAGACSTSH